MRYITKPWDHQRLLVEEKIRYHDGYGLFWEMGTGKTKAQIDVLRYHYMEEKRVVNTLIFCPPIVVANWVSEFQVHSKIPNVHGLTGPVKTRINKARKAMAQGGAVLVTNYEALLNKDFLKFILDEFKPEITILDEAHKIKNTGSKRYKACIKVGDQSRLRYTLTGTPILNNEMDLFALCRFLDKGERLGTSIHWFRQKYFIDMNAHIAAKNFPDWKFRPSMEEDLREKMAEISMSVTKDECLDLPPLVKKVIAIDMESDQKKAYEEMRKDLVAYIHDKRDQQTKPAVATMALTKTLRLLQIASGFASVENEGEDNSIVTFKKNPKAEALQEILEANSHRKIIVWAVFKQDYKTIRDVCESIKREYVECHGEISPKIRDEAVARFEHDDIPLVFLGHPGAGGIGVNLTASDLQIHFSRNFSLENDRQSEARNHRGGSERHKKITRVDLVTNDSIEAQVLQSLQNKEKIGAKLIFNAMEI